jgi:hypothetical protein
MSNIIVHQHAVSDIERMARAFAQSRLFGVTNPEQAVALCLIAQAEGRHPASAAQDYHIISGRPSKKADAMLRDFISGGGKVEWHELSDTIADATFSHPAGGKVRISWDMERAKQAQLKTPMWTKYPRQMLRARVVSEGVRTVYPMATSGMYVPEEVEDFAEPKEAPAKVVDAEPREQLAQIEHQPDDAGDVYERLSKANSALDSEDAFNKFWRARNVNEAVEALPKDLRQKILDERDDKSSELAERSAIRDDAPFSDRDYVPPKFDHEAA